MRTQLAALSAILVLASSVGAQAAATQTCRDAKGHFMKCPPKAAAAAQKCKDAKGKFAKCGTPGAMPVKTT